MPTYQEFTDQNLHRAFPLDETSDGQDTGGSFVLPTSLMTDMLLCVPNIPEVDVSKFYVSYVVARRTNIEIGLGYDDPQVPDDLGAFKGIVVGGDLQSTYLFTPSMNTGTGPLAALYLTTGQVTIGAPEETSRLLGNWRFDPSSTYIAPTRIARGLINVQYIQIGDRFVSGTVKFREGSNVTLDVNTSGDTTTITIDTEEDSSSVAILSDADVITALTNDTGVPIRSINGLLPDVSRNFEIIGGDCTEITNLAAGVSIGNPCARPCCPEDANIASLTESVENLNLKYAELIRFYELNRDLVNEIQSKLLSLGNTL
jgi:hypothetical protein